MKRIQLSTNTFTSRYFRIACKVSRATKLVKDLYAIAPRYCFITEEPSNKKGVILLTYTIPSGACDSELELIDNMIDFLLKEKNRG